LCICAVLFRVYFEIGTLDLVKPISNVYAIYVKDFIGGIMKNWHENGLTIGVCYYPEHWPKDIWENDLDRMLDMGIHFVRIAEFAWTIMEPEENKFDFTLFDEFMLLCEKKGMKVILGTPTATPPAWLTFKYPEVLNRDIKGTLYYHGHRRHYNMNTEIYMKLSKRIVEKMAEHYKDSPVVIGWQLDNEFNCTITSYHSEADNTAFIEYCKDKFKTLDNFNECMGNVFWSQTYTSWDQIHIPRNVARDSFNPHMVLEHKKFISHTIIKYAKMQSDTLRAIVPKNHFITTNGIFRNLDYVELTDKALDFMTYDSYPNFAFDMYPQYKRPRTLHDRDWSRNLSRVRGISGSFGIMEQQAGGGGWNTGSEAPMPKPGQLRLWTYQSIAHGADFVSYFRWRTSPVGTEIYWEGLNDQSNKHNRKIEEAMNVAKELESLYDIAGSEFVAEVAYLTDYINEYDQDIDVIRNRYQSESDDSWFLASQLSHTPMDYVYMDKRVKAEDLEKYSLLIYSHPVILTESTRDTLREYVKNGGTLVIGARAGFKDIYGRSPMTPVPGLLKDIAGAVSIEHTLIGPMDEAVCATWDDEQIEMPAYNEVLEPISIETKILAEYDNSYYKSMPAVTEHKEGKGRVITVGGAFSTQMAEKILEYTNNFIPYEELITLPDDCELVVRRKEDTFYFIILNYSKDEQTILLNDECTDMINNHTVQGMISLEGYGVMVLKIE